nr:MAG TPA: hypothetical protein [Caudoviricetes sp.]
MKSLILSYNLSSHRWPLIHLQIGGYFIKSHH